MTRGRNVMNLNKNKLVFFFLNNLSQAHVKLQQINYTALIIYCTLTSHDHKLKVIYFFQEVSQHPCLAAIIGKALKNLVR